MDDDVEMPELVRRLVRAEAEIVRLARLGARNAENIGGLRGTVRHVSEELAKCVTKSDFTPVQRVVYGIVGLILVAVMTALMGIALKGKP